MKVPFLDLSWQEAFIRLDREQRFSKIIEESAFVLGPHVESFEREFASYLGVAHTVGVAGGTQALTMIYRALGLAEGDEVLMIPTTFIASASSAVFAGLRPRFVDIDPATRDFNLGNLEAALTPKTRALLMVHLYGQPSPIDELAAFAKAHNLLLIEDACQAHGARYKGARVGTFGSAAAFSFYPGKNLGAYGDGGAVATQDESVAATVRALRNQGCRTKYDHEFIGYNGRLDALQAAVLEAKLPNLDDWNAWRARIAQKYREGLKDLPIGLPPAIEGTDPVWHLFAVSVDPAERGRFMSFLAERGIATGIHYPKPLHLIPALGDLGYRSGDFPNAEALAAGVVSLPVFPGMTDEQADAVIQAVRAYFHA